MKNMLEREIDLVLDCDEVLVFISPIWCKLIHNNRELFEDYLDLQDEFNLSTHSFSTMMRKEYYLLDHYLKKDINLTDDEKMIVLNNMMNIYDNPNFYDDIPASSFGTAISKYTPTKNIRKIYVVTKSTEKNRSSKERFLKKLFQNSIEKLEIIHLGLNEKKSDIIKKLGNNIGVVAEDELGNIKDIIKNCDNLKNVDFYIPSYGYNQPDEELIGLLEGKDIEILYYNFMDISDNTDPYEYME